MLLLCWRFKSKSIKETWTQIALTFGKYALGVSSTTRRPIGYQCTHSPRDQFLREMLVVLGCFFF